MQGSEEVLLGGNMNAPIRKDQLIYKEATAGSQNIHELLTYVRMRGIDWAPESLGINSEGKHVLTYIEGEVPHDTPHWLWEEEILWEVARKLRQWHDATTEFDKKGNWLLVNDEVPEVICHNDFAPYNCVFQDRKLVGVIDFDVCSPGSRLWDIAYTTYRFIPILPAQPIDASGDVSPFSYEMMLDRLEGFLREYSKGEAAYLYHIEEVLAKVVKRLRVLAEWSKNYGLQTKREELVRHAGMYEQHAAWLTEMDHCDLETERSDML